MSLARTLVILSFMVAAACVGTTPDRDQATPSVNVSERSSAGSAGSRTCDTVWLCEQDCPGFLGSGATNVEHLYCSDGTDTVIGKTACEDGCF